MRGGNVMAARELLPGIISDPDIMGGRPIIKGHRLTVSQVIGHIAAGDSVEEVRENYDLTADEIQAALNFAAEAVEARERTYVVNP
jgi:uncharacterized protein (DUF433 family)